MKLTPLTVAGMPGGPAGGKMIICGDGSVGSAIAGGTTKLVIDNTKMVVRRTKKAIAFFCECLCIYLTSKHIILDQPNR